MPYTLEQFQETIQEVTDKKHGVEEIEAKFTNLGIQTSIMILQTLSEKSGDEGEMDLLYNMGYFYEWETQASNYKEFYPND